MSAQNESLTTLLASSLPSDIDLTYYHISTPPTRCPALYTPPPGQRPEKTFCECHSLYVTANISHDERVSALKEVAIFALEIQIYTTANLTTVFVSKADSTGDADILKHRTRGLRSPLQIIASTFISWIIKSRHRSGRRLVVSLFARAQNQYLFPGSVEDERKHVLDDRQLVKWWCKTLDPVLRDYSAGEPDLSNKKEDEENHLVPERIDSKAYLIVPGHDRYETRIFFPASARNDPSNLQRWTASHPLREISSFPTAPPRSLVPHFPDDPKSRFLIDLDEEIPDAPPPSQSTKQHSPSKRGAGQWRSVKTLEQFWDMMQFRTECSSGRLVGFLWVTFTPEDLPEGAANRESQESMSSYISSQRSTSPSPLKPTKSSTTKQKKRPRYPWQRKPLSGPIVPRTPRQKAGSTSTTSSSSSGKSELSRGETTKYYHSPPHTHGTLVVSQKSYDRMHELLLRLDFSTPQMNINSTEKWVRETGVIGGRSKNEARRWGIGIPFSATTNETNLSGDNTSSSDMRNTAAKPIDGLVSKKRKLDSTAENTNPSTAPTDSVNTLNNNLVRKKPKLENALHDNSPQSTTFEGPNTLENNIVRKKPKTESLDSAPPDSTSTNGEPNILNNNLIRKKPKTNEEESPTAPSFNPVPSTNRRKRSSPQDEENELTKQNLEKNNIKINTLDSGLIRKKSKV